MKPESPRENKTITCSWCIALNTEADEFCHKCGYPLWGLATLAPPQVIQAQGFLFRKATEGRPRTITLIGIWICFLPWVIVGVPAVIFLIAEMRGLEGFIFFWVMIAAVCFAIVVLYRVTRNYFRISEKQKPRHD